MKCWKLNSTEYLGKFLNIYIYIWYNFAGLQYIQELAEQGSTEIRLDMTRNDNTTGHETCPDFRLTEGTKYKLNIGSRKVVGFQGNLSWQILAFFSIISCLFTYCYLA
jgi:hypothetical protein